MNVQGSGLMEMLAHGRHSTMGSLQWQLCRQHRHLRGGFVNMTAGFKKHSFYSDSPSPSILKSAMVIQRMTINNHKSSCSFMRATPNACASVTSDLHHLNNIDSDCDITTFDRTGALVTFLKNQNESLSHLNIHELFQQVRSIHKSHDEEEVGSNSGNDGAFESLTNIILETLRTSPIQESLSFLQLLLQDSSILKFQNVAMGISENLVAELDSMSEKELLMFSKCLQRPCVSEKPFYFHVKNHLSDTDMKIVNTLSCLTKGKKLCLNIWPSLLLNFAKAGVDFRLPPLPVLCQDIFQQLNEMSLDELKTFADLIYNLKKGKSWYAGHLLQIFQSRIFEVDSSSVFTSIACSVIHLCSSQFKSTMFDKFEVLFVVSSEHTVDNLIAMMKLAVHFESQFKQKIVETCTSLLKPLSDKMSLSQIVAFLYTCRYLYLKPCVIYGQMFNVLQENAKYLTNEQDIVQAADLLSQGQISLCEDVVNKLLRILDSDGTTDWSKLCTVSLRVSRQHPELAIKFRDRCLELLPEIQDVALMNTLARFIRLKCSSKLSAQKFLKEKFVTASYRAITPREHSCIVSGLYKLGLAPNHIDPYVWIQMRKFLPSLVGESSRRILSILGHFKFYHINPHDHVELCHLQRDVFYKILHKTPPRHLLLDRNESQSKSDANQSLMLNDNTWNGCSSITNSNVIGVSLFLHQTRMYYSDILEMIVEILHKDIHSFTPYEIRDAFCFLALCGVSHPKMDNICQAFAKRLVEFFDEMGPFIVVESTLDMAKLQYFDATLLKKIFAWQFLEKTEEWRPKPFLSHLLMQLNRAVCLESPELQVPWFHHEVNMETHNWKVKWNSVKEDIYLGLCDLLGEDGVHTGSVTPYNYLVDFEFYWNLRDISVQSTSKKITEKIAIDVLPRSSLFRNEPFQLIGEIVMKKRHLEILGYRYIPIPYHGWNRNLTRSEKVNYLRKLITNGTITS